MTEEEWRKAERSITEIEKKMSKAVTKKQFYFILFLMCSIIGVYYWYLFDNIGLDIMEIVE